MKTKPLAELRASRTRCLTEMSELSQAEHNQLLNRVASYQNQFQNIIDRSRTLKVAYIQDRAQLNKSCYLPKGQSEQLKTQSKVLRTATTSFGITNPESSAKRPPRKLSPFMIQMKIHSVMQKQCRNEIVEMSREKQDLAMSISQLQEKIEMENRKRYRAAMSSRKSMMYIQKTRDQSQKHTHELHRLTKLIEDAESECFSLKNQYDEVIQKNTEFAEKNHQQGENVSSLRETVKYLRAATARSNNQLNDLKSELSKRLKHLDKWAVEIELIDDERLKTLFEFSKIRIDSVDLVDDGRRL